MSDQFAREGFTFAQVHVSVLMDNSINDGAKTLYGYLVWRQGSKDVSWPSIGRIAKDLGVSEATVRRRLSELETAGYLRIAHRDGHSSLYTIHARRTNDSPIMDDTPCTDDSPTPVISDTQNDMQLNENHESGASAPAPRAKKRASQADARTQHPVIQCIKGITGLLPPKTLYDRIIREIPSPPDGPRMKQCFEEWVTKGHRPTNYDWLFDWYRNGIPERFGARQEAVTPPPPPTAWRSELTGEVHHGESIGSGRAAKPGSGGSGYRLAAHRPGRHLRAT